MKVARKILAPILIGFVSGILNFITIAINFTVPIGEGLTLAPNEIFNTIAGALGGPISLVVNELFQDLSVYKYIFSKAFSWPTAFYMTGANFLAHIIAVQVVIFGYRLIFRRMTMPLRLVAWLMLIGIFYFLFLLPLQALLFNIAEPGLNATLSGYFVGAFPEFIVTALITTLIWLALPKRLLKPVWYETDSAKDSN